MNSKNHEAESLRKGGAAHWSRRAGRLLGFGLVLSSPLLAQSTERVSLDSAEVEGNGHSFTTPEVEVATSADGRFVVFWSEATNLVAGDTNGVRDVFLRDRQNGTTERLSVDSAEVQGNEESFDPSISADGRYVAFTSHSTNLVPGGTNGTYDVYLRDRQAGTTVRVSVDSAGTEANSASFNASLSADGRYVAFQSIATNLVAGDTNGVYDIFVHDNQTGATERVSVDSAEAESNADSSVASISSDGRYVAFESLATNLVALDGNNAGDIFLRDRQAGTTERLSLTSAEVEGNGASAYPTISSDGRYVSFESVATDLVPSDTNGASDIFLRDRQLGTTERVSLGSASTEGNAASVRSSVSSDGRYVAFTSSATNLVAADTNGADDIFVRDRQTGTTERASVKSDGSQAGASSADPVISADGRFVVFTSLAADLVEGDTNSSFDVFLRDRAPPPLDSDGDGVPDAIDNCPQTPNANQADADSDGFGDVCDGCTDTDGDGFANPGFPASTCPVDGCPNDPAKSAPGACGCGVPDVDTDGDGVACGDGCPNDPAKTAPGACGCGVADTDTDGDGTGDCVDGCPSDPAKTTPGACGCGVADTDTDGDGTLDCNDGCPSDPAKTDPGQSGCGVPEGGHVDCEARRNPGSLLIFPEFDNRAGDVSEFTVTNTNTDFGYNPQTNLARGTIKVHFVYVGRVDAAGHTISCLEVDRQVVLTPGDTYTFLTRAHNPQQQQGFMYAYAEQPRSNEPVAFDYLIGSALFISGINAIDYSTNPVSLKAGRAQGQLTDIDSDGNRDLDGSEYEKLPDEILIPRFLATGGILRSELVLLGLSGGATFDTVADFRVYNDNEEVFSAQRQFRCWERVPLDIISGIFTQSFLATTNHAIGEPLGAPARESGWMQIDGGVAFSTVEQIQDPAIYAVLVERVARGAGACDLPFEIGCQDNGSLWPNGPYGDNLLHDNR